MRPRVAIIASFVVSFEAAILLSCIGDEPNAVDAGAAEGGLPDALTSADSQVADTAVLLADAGSDVGSVVDGGRRFRAFVTSATHMGNLGDYFGADATCTAVGSVFGANSKWIAWVSTTQSNAVARLTGSGPWYNQDREVARDRNELLSGSLRAAIEYDESGMNVGAANVWTGTHTDGTVAMNRCIGWTSPSSGESGQYGIANVTNKDWTEASSKACNQPYRLYCFEIP